MAALFQLFDNSMSVSRGSLNLIDHEVFVGVLAVLLIALIVVVSKLPNTNPLKRLLTALCYRLGATLAAGAIAIDLAYEVAAPIAIIWY
jgi:hypothetical protein